MYASAARVRLARWLFAGKALAFLGTISYSLYLWHYVVFQLAERSGYAHWAPVANPGALALTLIPVVLAIAWVSYRLTEHPFLVTAPAAHREHAPA